MTKCIYDAERRVERVPNPKTSLSIAQRSISLQRKNAGCMQSLKRGVRRDGI